MRATKLMTFYVLPLIALFVYFLPGKAPAIDPAMDRRSIAQNVIELYDYNKDQVLDNLESPLIRFHEIDRNDDYVISERELDYYLRVGSKNLIGDYAYYDAMPTKRARVTRRGRIVEVLDTSVMRWELR